MPRLTITSFQNLRLKEVQLLREPKTRKSTGLTIVEGCREVSWAWKSKVKFERIFVVPAILEKNDFDLNLLAEIESAGIEVVEVSKEIFAKISFGDRMDGVLAICRPKILRVEDFASSKMNSKSNVPTASLWVVVEDIEKPGNLGAILRTCDASLVDGVFVCTKSMDLYNPNVIRASVGAIFTVKMILGTNEEVLNFLKSRKVQLLATTPGAQKLYHQVDFKLPSALVLGSEEQGLSDFWLKHAEFKIKVPMMGKVDSLNVSATTAVMLYEALRQRHG